MIALIKYFFYCVLLTLILSSYDWSNEKKYELMPFGKWKIYKYLIGRDPTSLTTSEIKGMLGKSLFLQENEAIIINDTCLSPHYKMHLEGNEYFENNFRIDMNSLKITKDNVDILSLDCNTKPHNSNNKLPRDFSYDFIIISDTTLITRIGGDFFYLEKTK